MTDLNKEREALLPCPFCGHAAEFFMVPEGRYRHGVRCVAMNCGAMIRGTAYANDSFNTELWNTRSQSSAPAWIAVTPESMPEIRKLVWCSATNEMGESHQSALRWTGACWLNHWGAEIIDTITHWSPLPAPPCHQPQEPAREGNEQ